MKSERRAFLGTAFAAMALAQSASQSSQWTSKFRAFVKQLNRFIESLNDDMFDAKQWKRVGQAWRDLENETEKK